jgi:hypothetical protein
MRFFLSCDAVVWSGGLLYIVLLDFCFFLWHDVAQRAASPFPLWNFCFLLWDIVVCSIILVLVVYSSIPYSIYAILCYARLFCFFRNFFCMLAWSVSSRGKLWCSRNIPSELGAVFLFVRVSRQNCVLVVVIFYILWCRPYYA